MATTLKPTDLRIGRGVPAAKPLEDDLSNISTKKPVVELRRENLQWHKGRPQVVGHFSSEQYAAHRYMGPRTFKALDLLNPADVKELNRLERLAHVGPENKGPAILLFKTTQVVGDRWVCLAEFQDVFYREVLPPAVLHEPQQPVPKKRRTKQSPAG